MTDKDIPTTAAVLPRPLGRSLARELPSDLVEVIERAMKEAAAPATDPHVIAAQVMTDAASKSRQRDKEK